MRKELLFGIITAAVLAAAALLSLSFGTADISIGETLGILFGFGEASEAHRYIIMQVRVPRIITSLLVGMALAVSGVVFQALFRNPMAEPFILGVSSGAAFGVALGSFLGAFILIPGIWGVPVFAFGGAVGASFMIYQLSGRMRSSTVTLLLSGVAMNFFLSSLMSLLMFFNRDHLESIVYWSMGSFSSSSWDKLTVAAPLLAAGLLLVPRYVREMDLLLLGEQSAKAAGLSVKNTRIKLLVLATLLTSLAVAVSGVIGFVGLIIPHIVRMIIGPGHRRLIPFSLAAGGAFTLIADTLSRGLLPSSEVPVGIITSLAGAPFFIHLLKRQKKEIFS